MTFFYYLTIIHLFGQLCFGNQTFLLDSYDELAISVTWVGVNGTLYIAKPNYPVNFYEIKILSYDINSDHVDLIEKKVTNKLVYGFILPLSPENFEISVIPNVTNYVGPYLGDHFPISTVNQKEQTTDNYRNLVINVTMRSGINGTLYIKKPSYKVDYYKIKIFFYDDNGDEHLFHNELISCEVYPFILSSSFEDFAIGVTPILSNISRTNLETFESISLRSPETEPLYNNEMTGSQETEPKDINEKLDLYVSIGSGLKRTLYIHKLKKPANSYEIKIFSYENEEDVGELFHSKTLSGEVYSFNISSSLKYYKIEVTPNVENNSRSDLIAHYFIGPNSCIFWSKPLCDRSNCNTSYCYKQSNATCYEGEICGNCDQQFKKNNITVECRNDLLKPEKFKVTARRESVKLFIPKYKTIEKFEINYQTNVNRIKLVLGNYSTITSITLKPLSPGLDIIRAAIRVIYYRRIASNGTMRDSLCSSCNTNRDDMPCYVCERVEIDGISRFMTLND